MPLLSLHAFMACIRTGLLLYFFLSLAGFSPLLLGLAVSSVTSPSFLQERGETGLRVYQEDVLQGIVKHLNMTIFSGQELVFQQNSVLAQKAKTTQEWLRRNLLAFISAESWLSGSADLRTMDNTLWAVLEDMAWRKRLNSPESLRRSLVKAAAEIPLETERAATAEWPERLKACVEAHGGHFEWHYCKWKPRTIANNYLARKVDVLFNFPWPYKTTNVMHWILFIRQILLLSSTCFEYQVLIFRRT